jgi:hypothetical protein
MRPHPAAARSGARCTPDRGRALMKIMTLIARADHAVSPGCNVQIVQLGAPVWDAAPTAANPAPTPGSGSRPLAGEDGTWASTAPAVSARLILRGSCSGDSWQCGLGTCLIVSFRDRPRAHCVTPGSSRASRSPAGDLVFGPRGQLIGTGPSPERQGTARSQLENQEHKQGGDHDHQQAAHHHHRRIGPQQSQQLPLSLGLRERVAREHWPLNDRAVRRINGFLTVGRRFSPRLLGHTTSGSARARGTQSSASLTDDAVPVPLAIGQHSQPEARLAGHGLWRRCQQSNGNQDISRGMSASRRFARPAEPAPLRRGMPRSPTGAHPGPAR